MRILFPFFVPGIGDTIMKMPLLKAAFDAGVDVDIVGTNRNSVLDIAQSSGCVADVFDVSDFVESRATNNLSAWLADRKHDYFLYPYLDQGNGWFEKIVRNVGCAVIVRHMHSFVLNETFLRKLCFGMQLVLCKDKLVPLLKDRSDIESYLDLLDEVSEKSADRDLRPFCTMSDAGTGKPPCILNTDKYIAMQPGSADGTPTPKRWDPENYRLLASRLLEAYPDLHVVILGSKEDISTIGAWEESTRLHNCCGKTTLPQVADLLRGAAVTVAGDSGLMHLSNAVGTATVGLFGPTNFMRNLPPSGHVYPLFSKNEAYLCMRNGLTEYDAAQRFPGFSAMSGISVEAVFEEVSELLGKGGQCD